MATRKSVWFHDGRSYETNVGYYEAQMKKGIVKFLYIKLDGTVRTAWGTLKSDLIPASAGTDNRKKNDSVMVYFYQEKESYRCFKIANFLKIA